MNIRYATPADANSFLTILKQKACLVDGEFIDEYYMANLMV